MNKPGVVYIMASRRNGTIYIGVTSDLPARAYQHRSGLIDGFTKKYGCRLLVWYEAHDDLDEARYRERQLKKWNRQWKLRLVEEKNPDWDDLFESLFWQVCSPAEAGAQAGSPPPRGHNGAET